ncbi:MAG TPA: hypothetical protein VF691_05410 [Cytophagaceae bacterium]|jgi:hypothetical protein
MQVRYYLPYKDGFIGRAPDIGPLEKRKQALVAGALVRPQDISNIVVTYDNTAFPNKSSLYQAYRQEER